MTNCSVKHILRAPNVDVEVLLARDSALSIGRGNVIHRIHAPRGASHCSGVAQVAGNDLQAKPMQSIRALPSARETTNLLVPLEEKFSEAPAGEPRNPCDEAGSLHVL